MDSQGVGTGVRSGYDYKENNRGVLWFDGTVLCHCHGGACANLYIGSDCKELHTHT